MGFLRRIVCLHSTLKTIRYSRRRNHRKCIFLDYRFHVVIGSIRNRRNRTIKKWRKRKHTSIKRRVIIIPRSDLFSFKHHYCVISIKPRFLQFRFLWIGEMLMLLYLPPFLACWCGFSLLHRIQILSQRELYQASLSLWWWYDSSRLPWMSCYHSNRWGTWIQFFMTPEMLCDSELVYWICI